MSNSPQNKPAANNSSQPDIEFTTSNIGRWASKQENPFAEQNRKTAAKKRARAEKRQKARPIAVIAVSAVAIAAAIWGLVVLIISLINRPDIQTPVISGTTTEDIAEYRDQLQNFYNRRPDASDEERLQDVKDAIDRTLNTSNGKAYADQVRLAEIGFYENNGMPQEVVDIADQIDPENLSAKQQLEYYNSLANSYYALGNIERSDYYYTKVLSIPVEDL